MSLGTAARLPDRDLRGREDIDALLVDFYTRAFAAPLLAHVFVDVAHMDLAAHLPALGDFWEKVLFGTGTYTGAAMEVHRRLHRRQPLTEAHFGQWLEIWNMTVDARHAGPIAERTKAQAAHIAIALQHQLHHPDQSRPPGREALPLVVGPDEGGDPACWAAYVCLDCGQLTEQRDARACDACGAELPGAP
jgi:hemoglobin